MQSGIEMQVLFEGEIVLLNFLFSKFFFTFLRNWCTWDKVHDKKKTILNFRNQIFNLDCYNTMRFNAL